MPISDDFLDEPLEPDQPREGVDIMAHREEWRNSVEKQEQDYYSGEKSLPEDSVEEETFPDDEARRVYALEIATRVNPGPDGLIILAKKVEQFLLGDSAALSEPSPPDDPQDLVDHVPEAAPPGSQGAEPQVTAP